MTRRRKIIIALLIILLALAVLGFALYGRQAPAPLAPAPTPTAPAPNPLTSAPARVPPSVAQNLVALPIAPPPAQPDALHVAEIFAQRFASYSNQEAPFQNLLDLMPIMTPSYQAKVSAMVGSASQTRAAYQGTTSVKVSSRLVSSTVSDALAEVSLQQAKTDTNGTAVTYRTLHLSLVKNGDAWLVDSVAWVP